MKVYKNYKEIEIKDIKGARIDLDNELMQCKVELEKESMKSRGIRRPFEVIETGNGYKLISEKISFEAAKRLGYNKIPCVIRDLEKEILLRRLCKKLRLNDEDYEIKRREKALNYCRKKYYNLNVL